jgi:hypothetical protein
MPKFIRDAHDVPLIALWVGNLPPVTQLSPSGLKELWARQISTEAALLQRGKVWSCSTLFTPKIVGSYGCSSSPPKYGKSIENP